MDAAEVLRRKGHPRRGGGFGGGLRGGGGGGAAGAVYIRVLIVSREITSPPIITLMFI
jgi:hypothetical protein